MLRLGLQYTTHRADRCRNLSSSPQVCVSALVPHSAAPLIPPFAILWGPLATQPVSDRQMNSKPSTDPRKS